ncbi:MAG: beta-ketoacyl-ACP synthase II [Actinomycetota bacterium]|nr:beta-ketoacyl-ACP synthase II [Actinomycetota bacterium]MDK1016794.1 beta-ketoacyl-ACP synthase II [Actinomycetota bacterium]MDK1037985.1 beta-ketoacyl-ACP synthase II [Actinomycetota bacterium]MDK1291051.1 beta-ketoacyl-ACP synthase II [Actinomycetota bacterium]
MNGRRVVVTGLGTVTALGESVDEFWRNVVAGKSGVSRIERVDVSDIMTKIGAEIKDFDITDHMSKREGRRLDRSSQLFWVATGQALDDAGISYSEDDPEAHRAGVLAGTGIGGIETMEEQINILSDRGPSRISPYGIAKIISNMAGGVVSIDYHLYGPNSTTVTACAASANAIGDAAALIARDAADVMVAGGGEASVTRFGLSGFASARAMSTRNEDPEGASRPFDLTRDGFVMGEGAGVLILEELEHALNRGATMYAEVLGYGMSADGYHITLPRPGGEGAARSMDLALVDAGVAPHELGYINAHGTSTPANDKTETTAIKTVFGDAAYTIPVSSTKSMTGHLLGAAGAIESISCILAIRDGVIPPTINYETPDPECDLDYVPNVARQAHITTAMTNSFGFGGHNVSLIFGAPPK